MDQVSFKLLIEKISAAEDAKSVYVLVEETLRSIGADVIGYHLLRKAFEPVSARAGARIFPFGRKVHEQAYSGDQTLDYDPTLSRKLAEMKVFHWFDIEKEPDITNGLRALLDYVKEEGFIDGLVVPVIARPGDLAMFTISARGKTFPLEEADLYCLQCTLAAAHRRTNEIVKTYAPAHNLSARETDVLELTVRGRSNKEIAADLRLSPHTVDTLMRRIFVKLKVNNRTEAAIRFALMESLAS